MTLPKEVSEALEAFGYAEPGQQRLNAYRVTVAAILAWGEGVREGAGACHEEHVRCANELAEWRRAAVFRRDAMEVLAEEMEKRAIFHGLEAGVDFRSFAEFARKKATEPPEPAAFRAAERAFATERAQHITDIQCAERRLLKVEKERDGFEDVLRVSQQLVATLRDGKQAAEAEAKRAKDLAAKWKALSVLQDSLLACYRTGRNPGRVLDQLAAARAALSDRGSDHG